MGAKNLAPTGIRSPDRPNRSKSLYRLSYPSPLAKLIQKNVDGTSVYLKTMNLLHLLWKLTEYGGSGRGISKNTAPNVCLA